MIQKVQKYIEELNMVSPNDRLLIGVSGGADSVCLLLVLHELYQGTEVSLEVIHVEHGIRGEESREDAFFVENLCQGLQLPYKMVSVDVPSYAKEHHMGEEEAARILRYEVFLNAAKEKNAKVVLAHHMEDNAETILFQMARGSSLTGLCGMKPIRLDEEGVCYIRPLLEVHRNEIEAFLISRGQKYRVDSTNLELEYSRNYIRNKVLPALEDINVQAVAHINETAAKLSEVKEYLDIETEKHWSECAEESAEGVFLNIEMLLQMHPMMQKELVYRAITHVAGRKKDISTVHVETALALCENQSGRELSLPYQMVAKREFHRLHIYRKTIDEKVSKQGENSSDRKALFLVAENDLSDCLEEGKVLEIPLVKEGEKIQIRAFSNSYDFAEIPKNPYTKWMDYDKIKQGFCIRNRNSGDYFICDEAGHRKKVKQYFVDAKITAAQREQMWMLAQDHLVLWLLGERMSEHVKITEHTKTIVEIIYQGGQ